MSDLQAAYAEHYRLCHEARAAAATVSDLVGSCAEHAFVVLEGCASCAPLYAARVRHQQALERVHLAFQQVQFLSAANESQEKLEEPEAPAVAGPRWWQRLRRREVVPK